MVLLMDRGAYLYTLKQLILLVDRGIPVHTKTVNITGG
jgi:hypothetical protein